MQGSRRKARRRSLWRDEFGASFDSKKRELHARALVSVKVYQLAGYRRSFESSRHSPSPPFRSFVILANPHFIGRINICAITMSRCNCAACVITGCVCAPRITARKWDWNLCAIQIWGDERKKLNNASLSCRIFRIFRFVIGALIKWSILRQIAFFLLFGILALVVMLFMLCARKFYVTQYTF